MIVVEAGDERSRRSARRRSAARGLAGFARARDVRHDQHEIARQRLDVAHPVQPASGAAVQQHQRVPAPQMRQTTSPAPFGVVRRVLARSSAAMNSAGVSCVVCSVMVVLSGLMLQVACFQ